MLKRIHLITSGLILGWYVFGAASGWKGWVLTAAAMGGARSSSGGHGSTYFGGWGGGK